MRVLMFGWEFPPHASGGLGTACYGLTKSLSKKGVDITFVLPKATKDTEHDFLKVVSASGLSRVDFKQVDSIIQPYLTSGEYKEKIRRWLSFNKDSKADAIYGKNLYEEVQKYSERAALIAESLDFDVIHAHDWMTYQAGKAAKKASGKPLVVHIHATEFDRTGGNPNQYVYDIEREGFHEADMILAVSNFTRNKVIEQYDIPPEKVRVVHNAVNFTNFEEPVSKRFEDDKIVLFLGRLTLQKGPDYFLYAAKRVLEQVNNVKFVVAGSGDMEAFMIEKAAHLGISDKVLFTGFLSGSDIDRAYKMADLYVMPSVSEPFGITPLEALRNGTPVLISNQSGVSEVLTNALKVDFWDIDEMADKMVASLKYGTLHKSLQDNGKAEVMTFSWDNAADKCISAYNDVKSGAVRW